VLNRVPRTGELSDGQYDIIRSYLKHISSISSSSNNRMIKRRKRLAIHDAHMQYEKFRRQWEDNIKMCIKEMLYQDLEWINLAQGTDLYRAVTNGV
jgi:hypothetical protein